MCSKIVAPGIPLPSIGPQGAPWSLFFVTSKTKRKSPYGMSYLDLNLFSQSCLLHFVYLVDLAQPGIGPHRAIARSARLVLGVAGPHAWAPCGARA